MFQFGPRTSGRWKSLTPLITAAALAVVVAPTQAATTIGQIDTGTPAASCSANMHIVQFSTASISYTAASSGVITSWSHKAGSTAGLALGLRTFTPVAGTTYFVAGASSLESLTASAVNTFQTRVPVAAGDVLGVYTGPSGGASCAYGVAGNLIRYRIINPAATTGTSVDLTSDPGSPYLLNVSASIEADADGDGYGDETQDACPAQTATQAACVSAPTETPSPGSSTDVTPPVGSLLTKRDKISDGFVNLRLMSNEDSTATASASVRVQGLKKPLRIPAASIELPSNTSGSLNLKIGDSKRRALARSLRAGRKLKARVTASFIDSAGNAVSLVATVALRG